MRPEAVAVGAEDEDPLDAVSDDDELVDIELAGLKQGQLNGKHARLDSSSCVSPNCGRMLWLVAVVLLAGLGFDTYSLQERLPKATASSDEQGALWSLEEIGLGQTDAALNLRARLGERSSGVGNTTATLFPGDSGSTSHELFAMARASFQAQKSLLPLGTKVVVVGLPSSGAGHVYALAQLWLEALEQPGSVFSGYIDDEKFNPKIFATPDTAIVLANNIGPWLRKLSRMPGAAVLTTHRSPEALMMSTVMTTYRGKWSVAEHEGYSCNQLRRRQKCFYRELDHVSVDFSFEEAGTPEGLFDVIRRLGNALGLHYELPDIVELQRRYLSQRGGNPFGNRTWGEEVQKLQREIKQHVAAHCMQWQTAGGSIDGNVRDADRCLVKSRVDKALEAPKKPSPPKKPVAPPKKAAVPPKKPAAPPKKPQKPKQR